MLGDKECRAREIQAVDLHPLAIMQLLKVCDIFVHALPLLVPDS
jgi:hypothetical protein